MEEKKVKLWASAQKEYLHIGTYFEESLWLEFCNDQKNGLSKYYNFIEGLSKHLEKQERNHSNIDELFHIFITDLTLDFDFAKKLNIYDIIHPQLFQSPTDNGKHLIELIGCSDMEFILYKKEYYSENEIYLDFLSCHEDYKHELYNDLLNRKLIIYK